MPVISDENKVIWIGTCLAFSWWILEFVIYVVVFHEGDFVQQLFPLEPYELWMRTLSVLTVALIIIFSIYVQNIINSLRRAEQETKRDEEALRWQSTFDSTQDAICLFDADQRIIMSNRTMQEIVGAKNADELVGRHCWEVMHGTAEPISGCPFVRMWKTLARETMELKIGDRCFVVTVDPILDETLALVGAVHNIRDITERKRMEDQILQSLKEKEVLLKEIHHRVKNNMQVISSILNMEIKKIQDPVVQFSFEKIRHRIQTIAFVHELAYQSGDFVHISVEALIKKITSNALAYQQSDHGTLSIEIEASDLTVDLDKSVPFGILANELVSNAVLHAFPEGRDGEITISFRVEKGNNIFEFADNGVGLPAEIDFEHPETPGLKLIHGLAKQLNGEVEVLEGPGTRFRFKFPTEQSRG